MYYFVCTKVWRYTFTAIFFPKFEFGDSATEWTARSGATCVFSRLLRDNLKNTHMAHAGFFLEIFVRKFKRGNQRVLVQNWVKNVGINKCSLSRNLKMDLNFNFKVWWIENQTKSFQPHQGLALLVVLELVWSSDFLSIISKIGKPCWLPVYLAIHLLIPILFTFHLLVTVSLAKWASYIII